MESNRTFTLCVSGADPATTARIHATLEEQRGALKQVWRQAPYAIADVLFLESESVFGHMDWLKAQASGRRVVTLTTSPASYDIDAALRVPVNTDELVALLNRISGGKGSDASARNPEPLPARTQSAAPPSALLKAQPPATPVPPPPRSSPTESAPQPSSPTARTETARTRTLIDILEDESAYAVPLQLRMPGRPELLLDARSRQWYADGNALKPLAVWCEGPLPADAFVAITDPEFDKAAATRTSQPFARLLWLASLYRGQGRLAPALPVDGRFKLLRWPQSEREFPKHFRIATFMLKAPATLAEIAEASGASEREVADFINAYHSIGFIEEESATRAGEEAATRRGGLFGRLRKPSETS